MKEKRKNKFDIQDSQYIFPYHYLPTYDGNNFHIARSRRIGYEYISYLSLILDQLENIESFLDVGTGDGRFIYEVKNKFPDKYLRGIDLSSKAISFAKAFVSNEECILGDITDPAIFDGVKFSHISCIEVLEHIPPNQLNSFVKGISQHLKDNGTLLITVPSDNVPVIAKHFQHFNIESLSKTISPYFKIIDFKYINQRNLMVKVIESLLQNKFFILNNQRFLRVLFKFYREKLFFGKKSNTCRIFCICKKQTYDN